MQHYIKVNRQSFFDRIGISLSIMWRVRRPSYLIVFNDTINNWYTAEPMQELHAIEDNILGVYRGQRVFADKEDVDYAEEDYNDEDLQ